MPIVTELGVQESVVIHSDGGRLDRNPDLRRIEHSSSLIPADIQELQQSYPRSYSPMKELCIEKMYMVDSEPVVPEPAVQRLSHYARPMSARSKPKSKPVLFVAPCLFISLL